MKQNIFLIGENYDILRQLACGLANDFEMREFDVLKVLEFEIMPYSVQEFIEKCGEEKLIKTIKSIAKMECEFVDCICVINKDYFDYVKDIYEKIKENNLVIYLSYDKKDNFDCDIKIKTRRKTKEIKLRKKIIKKIKDIYKL